MGIGPSVAIPAATNLAGLNVSDIDLFEINEVSKMFHIVFFCFRIIHTYDTLLIHC